MNDATTKRIIDKVSKLYSLPTDEQPTLAQVKDLKKLEGQPFFAKAAEGDYILIYANSKMALLYRESENKLVNVGPITIQEQQAKAKVKVVNGTAQAARPAAVASQITAKLGEKVTVDGTYENAKTKNITKTTVVDISGTQTALAQEIATAIGGQVGTLPAGETKPSADILVIAGP